MTARHAVRGQTLVEFALVITVVLFILFAIVDFARALYTYDAVASGARLGTRYAIVHGTGCTVKNVCPAGAADIETYVRSKLTGINSGRLTVTTTWPASLAGCGKPQTPGCPVLVRVTYPYDFLLTAKFSTITLHGESEMIISN